MVNAALRLTVLSPRISAGLPREQAEFKSRSQVFAASQCDFTASEIRPVIIAVSVAIKH